MARRESSLLETIISGDVAWTPVKTLEGKRFGTRLGDLEAAGLVVRFPSHPVVTLSPLGAKLLGVVLVENEDEGDPYWAYPGDPLPPRWPNGTHARCRSSTSR